MGNALAKLSPLLCSQDIHCSEFDDCCSDYVKMCSQPLRSLVDSDSNGGSCVDYGCSLEYRQRLIKQVQPGRLGSEDPGDFPGTLDIPW